MGTRVHLTARVVFFVSYCRHLHYIPLCWNIKISQVHCYSDAVVRWKLIHVSQIQLVQKLLSFRPRIRGQFYHKSVVCPAPEFHHTFLFIKGKELYIYPTVRLVNCRRIPSNFAIMMKNGFGHYGYFIIPVSANKKIGSFFSVRVGWWSLIKQVIPHKLKAFKIHDPFLRELVK